MALVIVAAAAVLGAGLVRRLGVAVTRLEAACLATAAALTVAPWILLVAAAGLGFAAGVPVACAAMLAAGWRLGRGRLLAIDTRGPGTSRLSWLALGLLFALLLHGHMLHAERDGLYTGGSTYGDLALHATLANHFAVAELSTASPIADGHALTYPFLGDFLAGCLVRGGWSLSTAFVITGWLSITSALGLIQALALRVFGRRAAATLAAWLIVLSGSAIGILYAIGDLAHHGLPHRLADLPNYSHMRERGLVFANLVCDFLLPQRALVAGLPALWAAVWAMQRAASGSHDPGDPHDPRDRRALVAAAIAIGLLPMHHVHSFLVGAGLLGWLALWRSAAARRLERPWLAAAALAVAVAAPQLAWQFGHSWHGGFGGWQAGWLAPRGHFVWFWLRNAGLAIALVPAAVWVAARRRGGFALPFQLAAIALFAAANLYRFQPHAWDNMKLLVYAYMMTMVVVAGGLAEALAAGGVRRAAAALVTIALTATGAISIAREADRHERIASSGDLALAARLRAVLPADARVLTSDAHNHVVPMLTGRAIVMGYRGWLWTHGIDYRGLEQDVAAMFRGDRDADAILQRRGVTHVYIGPGERRDFHADLARFRARYPRVLALGDVEVFDVRPRPAALAARAARGAP